MPVVAPTGAIPTLQTSGGFNMPGTLKMLGILCIIFGALGLLGTLTGAAGLMFQTQIHEAQQSIGDPSQQALQAKIYEVQSRHMIPSILMLVCNLVIAPMLLIGGIGVLTRKKWSQKLFSVGLISAAVFVLVRTAVTAFMQIGIMGVMREFFTRQTQGAQQAATMEAVMVGSMYIGLGIGIALAIAMAAFYFWGWRHLKKDSSKAYFETFA